MRPRAYRAIALLALSLPIASAVEAGEIQVHRLFGPEVPTGPYKHPACMTELANGDLYLVYYGGKGEYATDTSVFGSRLVKGQKTWSPPEPIAHDPFRSVGNAVVWNDPTGRTWLFYVVRYSDTWSSSRIQFKVSEDQARSWSDASVLTTEEGLMVRNRPIVLSNGDYLLPAYKETGNDTEVVGAASTSLFFRFLPKVKTWTESGRIHSPRGNIQPAAVELDDKHLVAYCRRGGGYDPKEVGYIVRSESHDGGLSWGEGKDSPFPNPNAAVEFLKLKSGHLLLIYNDSMSRRTPLTAALSTDNDRTWTHRRNIVEGPGDFAYPSAFQASDGKIHLVYTTERRTVIQHAIVDEAWVLEGR